LEELIYYHLLGYDNVGYDSNEAGEDDSEDEDEDERRRRPQLSTVLESDFMIQRFYICFLEPARENIF